MSAFALLADLDEEDGVVAPSTDDWTPVVQSKKSASANRLTAVNHAVANGANRAQQRTVPTAVRPAAAVTRPAASGYHTQYQPKPATHDNSGRPLSDDYYRAFCRCYVDKATGEVCLRFHKTDVVKIRPNGDVILNTNQYYTKTTLLSMNDALQYIGCEVKEMGDVSRGNWLVVGPDRTSVKYADNAVIVHGTQASHSDRGRMVLEGMKEILAHSHVDDGRSNTYHPRNQGASGAASFQQQPRPGAPPPTQQAPAPVPVAAPASQPAPSIPGAVYATAAAGAVPWAGTGTSYAERLKQRRQQQQQGTGVAASASPGGGAGSSIATTAVPPAATEPMGFASKNAALTAEDFAAFLTPAASCGNLAGAGSGMLVEAGVAGVTACPSPGLLLDEDELLCTVCFEQPRETILIPCSHAVLCQKCADGLMAREGVEHVCPVCRTEVEFVLNIDG